MFKRNKCCNIVNWCWGLAWEQYLSLHSLALPWAFSRIRIRRYLSYQWRAALGLVSINRTYKVLACAFRIEHEMSFIVLRRSGQSCLCPSLGFIITCWLSQIVSSHAFCDQPQIVASGLGYTSKNLSHVYIKHRCYELPSLYKLKLRTIWFVIRQ